MTIIHDMLCRPTEGELELRGRLRTAQDHAEGCEEKLLIVDPREASDPSVHSRVCYERQIAAHAWRRANTLQSQLNGAENRRYSRGLTGWMLMGFGSNLLLKGGITLPTIAAVLQFLAGL